MRSQLLILICSVLTTSAMAECDVPNKSAPESFFISGVMKKNTDGATVRLVQSIERACSQQEALLIFAKNVAKQYPDYVLADALISEASAAKKSTSAKPKAGVEI